MITFTKGQRVTVESAGGNAIHVGTVLAIGKHVVRVEGTPSTFGLDGAAGRMIGSRFVEHKVQSYRLRAEAPGDADAVETQQLRGLLSKWNTWDHVDLATLRQAAALVAAGGRKVSP